LDPTAAEALSDSPRSRDKRLGFSGSSTISAEDNGLAFLSLQRVDPECVVSSRLSVTPHGRLRSGQRNSLAVKKRICRDLKTTELPRRGNIQFAPILHAIRRHRISRVRELEKDAAFCNVEAECGHSMMFASLCVSSVCSRCLFLGKRANSISSSARPHRRRPASLVLGDIGIAWTHCTDRRAFGRLMRAAGLDASGLVAAPGLIECWGSRNRSILVNPHLLHKIFSGSRPRLPRRNSIETLTPRLLRSIAMASSAIASCRLDHVCRLFFPLERQESESIRQYVGATHAAGWGWAMATAADASESTNAGDRAAGPCRTGAGVIARKRSRALRKTTS